jgi:tRNA 2-selenouridine synthase
MIQAIEVEEFILSKGSLIDVRSPSEFKKAHIPSAYSLPLLSDKERSDVGTLYKQQGKEVAIEKGLEYIAPKITSFFDKVKKFPSPFYIYCWRGGMRSHSIAHLFKLLDCKSKTLKGGYKSYRQWVLNQFNKKWTLHRIGGYTGVGKTEHLYKLKQQNKQIIDLEKLAHHRGSVFGKIGLSPQPSTEAFENNLAYELSLLSPTQPIWIEDESRLIGLCQTPTSFFNQMRKAPITILQAPMKERIERLYKSYHNFPPDEFLIALNKLQKRLGEKKTTTIKKLFLEKNTNEAIELLLIYYDKSYDYKLKKITSK